MNLRRAGFTLLEVLVALAIAAMAFAALYRGTGQSLHGLERSRLKAQAAMLGQSLLAGATWADDLVPLSTGEDGPLRWQIRFSPSAMQPEATDAAVPVAPVAVTQVHLAVYAQGEDLPLWEIELPLLNRSQSR